MNEENFVSTDWVLKKLGFGDMPMKMAYESIADLVTSKEINLYFDSPVRGTDKSVEIEMQYEASGAFLGALIGNGHSYQHDGVKSATALYIYSLFDTPKFAIQEYIFKDKSYYVTDDEGIWNREKHLVPNEVFFDRKQIESLSKTRSKNIDGKMKALALLAREMAEDGARKYRTGNKVNAAAIKEHIITLAKKYDVSSGYLKSLDDTINQSLIELELKELPPSNK